LARLFFKVGLFGHMFVQALREEHPCLKPLVKYMTDDELGVEAGSKSVGLTQDCIGSVREIYGGQDRSA
jgi:hypothetical protein